MALEEEEGRGRGGEEGPRPRRAGTSWNVANEVLSDLEGGGRGWGGPNKYLWSTSCVLGAKQPVWAPAGPGWGELQAGVRLGGALSGQRAGRWPGGQAPTAPSAHAPFLALLSAQHLPGFGFWLQAAWPWTAICQVSRGAL